MNRPESEQWQLTDSESDLGRLSEACGIFGCVLDASVDPTSCDVAAIVTSGLSSLQHRSDRYLGQNEKHSKVTFFRGNEGSGIVGSKGADNDHLAIAKGKGLVRSVYDETALLKLKGICCDERIMKYKILLLITFYFNVRVLCYNSLVVDTDSRVSGRWWMFV